MPRGCCWKTYSCRCINLSLKVPISFLGEASYGNRRHGINIQFFMQLLWLSEKLNSMDIFWHNMDVRDVHTHAVALSWVCLFAIFVYLSLSFLDVYNVMWFLFWFCTFIIWLYLTPLFSVYTHKFIIRKKWVGQRWIRFFIQASERDGSQIKLIP